MSEHEGGQSRRIDRRHRDVGRGPMDREPLAVSATELERHAAELSDHLRRQQSALDQREALIHSQLAALESQRRQLRARTEERMDAGRRAAAASADGDDAHSTSSEGVSSSVQEREAKLADAEQQLARKQQSVRDANQAVADGLAVVEQRERQLDAQQERCDQVLAAEADARQRIEAIAHVERSLGEQYHQLEAQRRELSAARQQFTKDQRRVEAELAERQRAYEAHWEQRRRKLRAEADRNDRKAEAQAAVRRELAKMHREMLELGIALQEVWNDLSSRVSMPTLSQSLLHIRAQLADTYRLEREALAKERSQLHSMATRLAEHKRGLDGQRHEMKHWAERRSVEFEQQAAQLVARQQDLDRQRQQLADERHAWLRERRELESKLRDSLLESIEVDSPHSVTSERAA